MPVEYEEYPIFVFWIKLINDKNTRNAGNSGVLCFVNKLRNIPMCIIAKKVEININKIYARKCWQWEIKVL
jgi:hypothetical protein